MTKNKFFKIALLTLLLVNCALFKANAQATVGSESNPNATLEVVATKTDGTTAEGIIAPRLTGDQIKAADAQYGTPQNGAFVYATAAVTTASPKTINVKYPGFYYYDAPNNVWVAFGTADDKWFYMPSFNLPLGTTIGAALTYNLYQEYSKQFQQSGNPQFVASTGAADPAKVMTPYAATELEFYVTAYSTDIITVTGLDANGTLHYTAKAVTAPKGSFVDIIFKIK